MKERLTGAIILVALIVLLVPELLTGPIHPAPAVAANSSEEPPLRTYTIHLAENARSQAQTPDTGPAMPQPNDPAQSATAPQTASSSTVSGETSSSTDASVAPNRVAPTGSNPPEPVGPGPARGSGSTASSSGNQTAEASPGGHGIHSAPMQSHPRTASAGANRTGSSTGRATAGSATVQGGAGATADGSGWMVQLGVFASRDNAEHLAHDLKTKGFKAAVSAATSGNRHLFRVRVGPAADRAAAQELQGRLRAAGRAGTVVPVS